MPLLKLETTVVIPEDKRKTLLASLSKTLAETLAKPEQYVMVTINPVAMLMSGNAGDAAFLDVRSIGGLSNDVNKSLSQKLCNLLNQSLGIAPNRIYMNFTDVEPGNWGWNVSTFG